MEDILTQITKDASSIKHVHVRKAAQDALDLLQDRSFADNAQAYQLRERCLQPLQLALESKNNKLVGIALAGLQRMLTDNRFHSSLESEKEEKWLPMQILEAVCSTPTYTEEAQVEIMKVLLNMTFTTNWCMNAKVITKISELCMDTYGGSGHSSVKMAVRATLTQLLTALTEKIQVHDDQPNKVVEEDVLADFSSKDNVEDRTSLIPDVVTILTFLCEKLSIPQSSSQTKQIEPLLLEGIHAILENAPLRISDNQQFIELVWKQLCPVVVSLLGNPKAEKGISSQRFEGQEGLGRGSGCSSAAPNLQTSSAKTIYGIAVQLVRLVGGLHSMRPVLESLYHRMLLYPPPGHRHEAIKAIKELLSSPERLYVLAGPTENGEEDKNSASSNRKRINSDIALLKLIIDCLQECCHSNDSAICITAIQLVTSLLASLEQICHGEGLTEEHVSQIMMQYTLVNSMDPDVLYGKVLSPSYDAQATFQDFPTEQSHNNIELSQTQNSSVNCSRESTPELSDNYSDKTDSSTDTEDATPVLFTQGDSHSSIYQIESLERESARRFVQHLSCFLPVWLECGGHLEVDEVVIEFASKFCNDEMTRQSTENPDSHAVILNGDGVYIATYSALLLNLKLVRCAYYNSDEKSLPISENEFINEILSCGLLLYLSPAWLSELYTQIIEKDLLGDAGYSVSDDVDTLALIQVLTDIDGLGSRKSGGQLLYMYRENEHDKPTTSEGRKAVKAGMRLAEQVLISCWDGILEVLSILLNGKSSCGITSSLGLMLGTEGAMEESMKARHAISTSLDGLQKAARLACLLGLHERVGAVFAQLANASCVVEDTGKSPMPERKIQKSAAPPRARVIRVHAAHALSLDLVLSGGLEKASHSQDCWQHVFRCSSHVAELEHAYFSSNSSDIPKLHTQSQDRVESDSLVADDSDGGDLYAPLTIPAEPVAPNINVTALIKQANVKSDWDAARTGGEVLPAVQTPKVLCGLSQQVDRFYEDAANKLNMKALVGFLTELCKSSQIQLSQHKAQSHSLLNPDLSQPKNAMHLYRLGDVLLKCLHGGRPLMHIMRAWAVVAPHLVEAACHRDRDISKKAVECIHECVTTLLSSQQEHPHFHFNEALCKPFENLLCLELCDGDVQDQVVCSVCELVEGCATEIKSGWRPLFGALRAVKLQLTASEEVNEARQRHIAAVLDVFEVFLNTDNVWVFANAAVDCILCLLKYVKGPAEFAVKMDEDDYDSDSGSEISEGPCPEDICIPALNYLRKCCTMLASMWTMPACPIFQGANRIKLTDQPKYVDPVIPNMDFDEFSKLYQPQMHQNKPAEVPDLSKSLGSPDSGLGIPSSGDTCGESKGPVTNGDLSNHEKDSMKNELNCVHIEEEVAPDAKSVDSGCCVASKDMSGTNRTFQGTENEIAEVEKSETKVAKDKVLLHKEASTSSLSKAQILRLGDQAVLLEDLDNHTGILHVWFLILDGLANIVSTCPKNYQPQTMEVMFDLLQATATVPGPKFSIHCVNHLLLPMMQSWLRTANQTTGYWDKSAANFKQCAGLCTDLVVEYITQFENIAEHSRSVQFMLQQLLDTLIECIAQPVETLSRLGCACIRHLVLSAGPILTEELWYTASCALERAFDVSLYSLKQLMTPFHTNSDNFYGDIGQVKVAVRKDCSSIEAERLRQLANQVFLLDSQRSNIGKVIDYEKEEDRSYIFLLYPQGENTQDHHITRVPFKRIVVGLLSHHLLLQTVGCLLLQGSNRLVGAEKNLLPSSPTHSPKKAKKDVTGNKLPGMLKYTSSRVTLKLLHCLWKSHQMALNFDLRPGLKFLIQKVIKAEVAANLYKQACVSLTFYTHTLIEICVNHDQINIDETKRMLDEMECYADHCSEREQYFSVDQSGHDAHFPIVTQDELHDKSKSESQYGIIKVSHKIRDRIHMAESSTQDLTNHYVIFMYKLKLIFDHICAEYVDMYLEKEGPSIADRLAEGNLVFLIAQPDDIPQLKRDRDIKEIVAEKVMLKHQMDQSIMEGREMCIESITQPVTLNDEEADDDIDNNPEPAMSPGDSPQNEKLRDQDLDKIYTVATDRTLHTLMYEYKKRKNQHTLPTFVRASRSKPLFQKKCSTSGDAMDQEIDRQQRDSLMKDSEAHLKAWIEFICGVLEMLQQLSDSQFHSLLPPVFACLNQLVCYCKDARMRESLALWIHRVGVMHGFVMEGIQPPKARPEELAES